MLFVCIFSLLVVSYLLGCVNGALIVSGKILKDDVRRHGSGNAGLTNSLRTYGAGAAIPVALIDIVKTLIAAGLGGIVLGRFGLYGEGRMIAGVGVLIGHIFPVFYGFKGGKGVLSGGTLMLFLDYRVGLISIGIFLVLVLLSRMVSLGSIVAAVAMPLLMCLYHSDSLVLMLLSALVMLLLLYKHIPNFKRIVSGTESKLSFGKKRKG